MVEERKTKGRKKVRRMNNKTTKSLKIAITIYLIGVVISFFYGGVYTEMYLEGLGFNIINLLFALIGAFIVMIPILILAFVITFIVYYVKNKEPKETEVKQNVIQ